ncbi:hypothetical protein [Streptomyces sp. NPDC059080]|uniref:hypothetical protein n=1 Tax=Streptomyces sp. NPDC059080 TaxID=3346718 RepID=UPI00367C8A70
MSPADGYEVDPATLRQITKGINGAISELKELGFDTDAQLGHGFDTLALSGLECGDPAVAATFDTFCERWGWGIRSLIHEANEFARRLDLSAGIYHEQEQYVSTTLKVGVNAAMGDPTKSTEQLRDTSWDGVLDENPYTQFQHANWDPGSAASMETYLEGYQALNRTAEDFRTSTWAGDADHNWALRMMPGASGAEPGDRNDAEADGEKR